MGIWLQFAACAALVLYSGTKLSLYGDVIAEKTGAGRTWIGVALLASVTSLPELITGVSSVALFDLPDIAAGDVLGSCMFNLLIVGALGLAGGVRYGTGRAPRGHLLAAGFGIVMLGLAGMSIAAGAHVPRLGWFGLPSLALIGVYLLAMRSIFLNERSLIAESAAEAANDARYGSISKARAFALYAANAVVIVAAAAYLPRLGEAIAAETRLGETFVGSTFVALTTSLPEVVVSLSALRIGAADIALGNLFGSNLFNVGILALDDLFYAEGPLLAAVSADHAVAAFAAVAMTAVAAVGLINKAASRRAPPGWDSAGIVAIYVAATALLYAAR